MRKHGQATFMFVLAIAVALVVLVLGLTLGIGALFSTRILLYVLGGSLLLTAVMLLFKRDLNSTTLKTAAILGMIGLVIVVAPILGIVQNTSLGSSEYIQVPLKGFYTCEPASVSVLSPAKTIPASTTTIACPRYNRILWIG